MTDVRQTLRMPYARQAAESQPEPTPEPTPGPGPEPIPEPLQDDKPPPVVLAEAPSAEPAGDPEPQAAAETVAEIVTSDATNSSAHSDAEVIHAEDQARPLWPDDEARKMSQRWERIQDEFVDKPRKAVEEANSLVAAVATRLTEMFDAERARLEGQWNGDGEVSAEELHIALQRYRAFFGRSLAI